MGVPRAPTQVELPDVLLRTLDERAAREGQPRAVLIRKAIEAYLYDEVRGRIDREIIEGYERSPATEEDPW